MIRTPRHSERPAVKGSHACMRISGGLGDRRKDRMTVIRSFQSEHMGAEVRARPDHQSLPNGLRLSLSWGLLAHKR